MTPWIYISHRPAAADAAERLRDGLQQVLGTVGVLLTQRDPAATIDWPLTFVRVGCSTHFVALIDPGWLHETTSDPSKDEIALAFKAGLAVVPVTVRGARLFAETNLPESVRKLAGAKALDLREDAWAADVGLIADRLFPSRKPNAPLIAEPEPPPRPNTLREPRASGSPPDVRERAIIRAGRTPACGGGPRYWESRSRGSGASTDQP